jgi:hypothetical protein
MDYGLHSETARTLPDVANLVWNNYAKPGEHYRALLCLAGTKPGVMIGSKNFGILSSENPYYEVGFKDFQGKLPSPAQIPSLTGNDFIVSTDSFAPKDFDPKRFEKAIEEVRKALGSKN